ncbi:uncharacterized protein LOC144746767 [Ciona intestinalis]
MYEEKRYMCVQGSKKRNCSAHIGLREIIEFPKHKLTTGKKSEKDKISRKLRSAGLSNVICEKNKRFTVQFPLDTDHSGHPIGEAAGILQRVDKRLITKTGQLLDEGVSSIMEIKRHLKLYVMLELFKNETPPSLTNRRFFPTKKDLRNHYNAAFAKRKLSHIDQENVHLLINEWSNNSLEDNMFFRSYVANVEKKIICDDNDDSIPVIYSKQTMLFVYQTAWQRRLLVRYGQDICLLDATYKTSKYALPLFFLCIKTNVNYQVVACFVTQNERQSDITEALEMIKTWTPGWNPTFFMTDNCEAEILSIEATFKGCKVLLCDFHREQAWLRWLRKSDNGVGQKKDAVLYDLRSVAKAENNEEMSSAVDTLEQSEAYMENPKLQKYFKNVWLKEKERWVSMYRVGKMRVPVGTNNGVERQNRMLKECHIKFQVDKSLSGLVKVLHKDFLPAGYKKYIDENALASDSYRSYLNYIPPYLHNRPPKIVKHCMKRLNNASSIPTDDVTRVGCTVFKVRSSESLLEYEVYFGSESEFPKCSCPDFKKWFLPCKHMFAVFNKYDDVSWSSLPKWYSDSVYITLDNYVIKTSDYNSLKQSDIAYQDNQERIPNEPITAAAEVKSNAEKEQSKCDEPSKKIIIEILDSMNTLKDKLYDVHSHEALVHAKEALNAVHKNLDKFCKHEEGVRVLKPQIPIKLKKKRNMPSTFVYDELPRKFPKTNKFKSRHGTVAEVMSALHAVTQLEPPSDVGVFRKKTKRVAAGNSHAEKKSLPCKVIKKSITNEKILPCKVVQKSITDKALQHGPYSVTYLQLLSLELELMPEQIQKIQVYDKQFRVGWLYDEIINSFLSCLCRDNEHVMYADSAVAQMMERGNSSLRRLWTNVNLSKKKLIFIPWNPNGCHWVLLAVDIKNRQLLYLDPLEKDSSQLTVNIDKAKLFLNNVLNDKFGIQITSVDTMSTKRKYQSDYMSCGPLICMYAKWLCEGKSLLKPITGSKESRELILRIITKNTPLSINICGSCRRDNDRTNSWVQCTKCPQWFHTKCVGMNMIQAKINTTFCCP